LGYTTWSFGTAGVNGRPAEGVTVRVPVTNTGSRPGATVVQCYVEAPTGGPRRPVRELKGFAKVFLQPGETLVAEVWLPERAFAVWDVAAHDWRVPSGDYQIWVGASSRDLASAGATA
jgi:beta-glucosidase